MQICAVLSNLGALNKLKQEYPAEYAEIESAIRSIQAQRRLEPLLKLPDLKQLYHPNDISRCLEDYFATCGWKPDFLENTRFAHLQAVKRDIGIAWSFGKYAFNESDLFVKFPLFIQSGKIKMAVLLIPMKFVIKHMAPGVSSYETIKSRISSLQPFPLKYPFVIIGFGDKPVKQRDVSELTSDLDQYLLDSLGMSFFEMKIQTEKPAYDFKQQLPENTKIAKELCAFANQNQGGLILVGMTDSGELIGIPEIEVDGTQLRVIQVAQSNCIPPPQVDCQIFEIPHQTNRRALVIRIYELEQKPCMVDHRIYIRRGSSASPANPNEVRKLILGRNTPK
jgi:hypothetical protein